MYNCINCSFCFSGSWGVIFVLLQKEYFKNDRMLSIYDSKLRKPRKYRVILYSIYRLFIKSLVLTCFIFASEIQKEKTRHNWQPVNLFKVFSCWYKVLLTMDCLHKCLNGFYKSDRINGPEEAIGIYTSLMGTINADDFLLQVEYDVSCMTKKLVMLLRD